MIAQLPPERILADLKATNKKELLQELAATVHTQLPALPAGDIYLALHERENLGTTGIGDGAAIPHAKIKALDEILIFFGRSRNGIMFDAQDGKAVFLFFLLLAPEASAKPYLSHLAHLARFLKNNDVRERLMRAADRAELVGILAEAD